MIALDGKFANTTDVHYPQAQSTYGEYSYFKPKEAYQLKKQIEREKLELKAYFEDSFDENSTNLSYKLATGATGLAQVSGLLPGSGPFVASMLNQIGGRIATEAAYSTTKLKDDLAKMGSQRNLVNTYVWTMEGGFFAESNEVAETQQETFAGDATLSLGGAIGAHLSADVGVAVDQQTLFNSGSSFTLTKSKTKSSSTSFGLDVSVSLPTSPRFKYGGSDDRTLTKMDIPSGTVDAYRFMSFYLEPKGEHFIDLFSMVVDPIWLEESPAPNAQALRQARGNIEKAKPCWRIMHRVTFVSRVLPEFPPHTPPSLEKSMRMSGIESNYLLVKKFEPYVKNETDPVAFQDRVESIIDTHLPEFALHKRRVTEYLKDYFNII